MILIWFVRIARQRPGADSPTNSTSSLQILQQQQTCILVKVRTEQVFSIELTSTLEKLPRYSSKMVVVCLSSFSLERRTGFSSGVLMSAFCTMASTSLLSLTDGTELSRDVGCGLSRCALLPRELRPSVTIIQKITMH